MQIEFTLNNTLDDLGVSCYKFAQMSGVRKNTILDMYAGKSTRIHTDVIVKILNTLNECFGGGYDIQHIFIYKTAASE